jgi:hypothetical protein
MPRIFVSSVIAQLVDLMGRNFVTGASQSGREVERLERMNDRTREIFRDPRRARPASAVDGLRRGERSRLRILHLNFAAFVTNVLLARN